MCGERAALAFSMRRAFSSGPNALPTWVPVLSFRSLLLPQPNAQDVPRHIHYAEEEADFLIDRFRCGLFTEPGFLVFLDRLLIDIDQHFVAEQPLDVAQSIFRECRGAWVAQFIADEVFVSQVLDGPHALLANILEIVETLFKFTAPLLLSRLGECF